MKVCNTVTLVLVALLAFTFGSVNTIAEAGYDEQTLRDRLKLQGDDHLARARLVQLLVARKSCVAAKNNAEIIINTTDVPDMVKENLGLLLAHCKQQDDSSFVLQLKPRIGYDSRPTSFSQDLGYSASSLDAFPVFEAATLPIIDYYDPAALGANNRDDFSGVVCSSAPCDSSGRRGNDSDKFAALSVGLVYGRHFDLLGSLPSRLIIRNRVYNRSYRSNDHYNVNSLKSGVELNTELQPGWSGLAGVSWWYQKTAADLKFDSFSGHLGLKWQADDFKSSIIYERLHRDYNENSDISWSQSSSLTLLFSNTLFDGFADVNAHYKYSDNEVSGSCQGCSLSFSSAEVTGDRFLDYHSVSYGIELEKEFSSGYKLRVGYRDIDYKGLSSGINSYQRFNVGLDKLLRKGLKWDLSVRSERHNSDLYDLDDRNVLVMGLSWVWDG